MRCRVKIWSNLVKHMVHAAGLWERRVAVRERAAGSWSALRVQGARVTPSVPDRARPARVGLAKVADAHGG